MPVNVLIVGGGSIGERHLRCFQKVGAQVALCEINDALRQTLTDRYDLGTTFGDVTQAAKRSWDAAVICTPAHLHIEHAMQLAPSCNGLLIEKPLSTALDNVPKLRDATQGKTVAVAYVMRSHPAVQEIHDLLQAGTVGRLLQVTVVSGQHFPTFRPAYREIYYTNRATGGGAVQDAATHSFNLVQYLAGRFDWIFCDYAHQALEGVEVEDTVHFLARAAGETVMASIALNQFMAPNETVLQLNGTEGSVQFRSHEARYGVMQHGQTEWSWSQSLVMERDELFRIQAGKFLDACAGKIDVLCDLAEAEHTLRVNLAALESAGNCPVRISIPDHAT